MENYLKDLLDELSEHEKDENIRITNFQNSIPTTPNNNGMFVSLSISLVC